MGFYAELQQILHSPVLVNQPNSDYFCSSPLSGAFCITDHPDTVHIDLTWLFLDAR